MPLDGRFPHFPGRAWGNLYGRGPSTVVLWADDRAVEDPQDYSQDFSAPPEDLEDFVDLLDGIRTDIRPRNLADVHDAVLSAGWEDRGTLKYDARSGLLLADSAALAEMAEELEREREEMLAEAGGRHPDSGGPAWARWVTVISQRTATVRGARALALAAVEALVNELLAAQHPGQYHDWEIKRRMGFLPKLVSLLGLHDLDPSDVSWFEALEEHAQLRNSMIHHRPRWIVDDTDHHSVAPDADMTQERLIETLEVAHQAVGGLFALYGAPVPDTHRPDWLKQTAGW